MSNNLTEAEFNMKANNKQFNNPTLGRMSLDEVIQAIVRFIQEDPESKYSLIVGTDSQNRQGVDFVTAIIIHRKGNGGRYFWQKIRKNSFPTLRDRIYEEAILSITLAQELKERLKTHLSVYSLDDILEIHVDIGKNGPTRAMINEVVGMIKGNGFNAKIKPEAYGAFVIADKYA